ncbi:hypothetical protein OF117_03605 [Geodermatophilus sp. YIM 151500]|uniref:hypothetical protein n=1 Tax=Geodermatophilus sp. YIM 151500 TaxID=2984531 RepID=UPI0021E48A39|nr:hypothetical protein [Geodermatophilus sp. YIM 151500]MCV2488438.1 hypothetical protein [Geodermatophilus sp. YIM 151500]
MELDRHVGELREALAAAAAAGTPQAQETARLLADAMGPAVRLVLIDALSEMAAQVTAALDGPTVDVRVRGGDPEVVVTPAPHGPVPDEDPAASTDDDSPVVRISLRLPDFLKDRAEQAAAGAGTSLNAWLGRAVADALRAERAPWSGPSGGRGPRRWSGYARS